MSNFSNCPNCGKKIGCSCSGGSQIKTASDSKTVCSSCITTYEQGLAVLQGFGNIQNTPIQNQS
jgi:hypothetical protein